MNEDCIFCGIAEGRVPASIIAETDTVLAFMDINQPAPGHVLVIPRAHIPYIYTLEPAIAADLFQLTVRVSQAVKAALSPDGLNLHQSNERAAQQEVFHFHMHIFARYEGDRDRIRFGWQKVHPEKPELDRLAEQIRAALPAAAR